MHNSLIKLIYWFIPCLFSVAIACDEDVQILQGSSIEMCASNPVSINATEGYVSYTWSGAGSGSSSSLIPTVSGTYTVDAEDALGCISSASIDVTINENPTPTIISSEGTTLCEDSPGTALSLDQAYSTYNWSSGSTDPSIFVNSGGIYSVQVTDANGCAGTASITINQIQFTFTASSTSSCQGSAVVLQGSGAIVYAWSTGEFGSTIIVAPDENTTYSVTMTNGSCSKTFVQEIVVNELPEYEMEDTVYTTPGSAVFINGPEDFLWYEWSPTDNISNPNNHGVTFLGDETTLLTLNAGAENGCTISQNVLVIVVRLGVPGGFSPNNDGINDYFIIPELYEYPGELVVWNRWGDVVYQEKVYKNTWRGKCETAPCLGGGDLPEGTYFYKVTVDKITQDGFLTLKR